jgi:23S rRNA (uracil1939-C5)-methyltransferase
VEGDAAELLRNGPVWGTPDVVVVDPPRAGLHPDLRAVLPELGARRLVYVSCNPTTLARDLKEICQSGFELRVVQPVDMFPHTPHVECVTLLERSSR